MSYVRERYDDAWKNENSGPDVVKLTPTLSYLKSAGDDVEVQERWIPTPGCKACESAHGIKHVARCDPRRHEYRLRYGRNPLVTTRRVYHELERAPEGAGPVASEPTPVSDREGEPGVPFQAIFKCTHFSHICETFALERTTTRSESRKLRERTRSQSTQGFVGYVSTCTREHETWSSWKSI